MKRTSDLPARASAALAICQSFIRAAVSAARLALANVALNQVSNNRKRSLLSDVETRDHRD